MIKRFVSIVFWALLLCSSKITHADFDAKTVSEFLLTQAEVYASGSSESVERFVAFMSDDIKDYHFAYGREFSGKDFYRENMPKKAKALISYDREILQILMGTNVAVATFYETTEENKPNGSVNRYSGRTLMVIEFNNEGLITHLRRYQD